jgi:glucokinase
MGEVCFGIDIGGTAVKVGLFNTEGKLLNKWDFATRKTNGEESILTDTASFVLEKAKELKLDKKDILGVGVGIPGPVKENGEVLELANLALERMNIEDELEKLLGLKVKAGNDANVAALGEYWVGGGKGYKNLVLVTLGTGVGGGIILNGSVLAGSNGAAGEIGHMLVNENETKVCGCGKKGCLEQYASATGIVRLATNILAESTEPSTMRSYTELSAKTIFDCAKEDDKLALQVVEKACRYLGITLAHIAQVIDPEVFVIGGGVSKAGEIITETTKKYFNANVMNALKNKEFRLATLGNDAGIYGAAKLILG